MSRFARAAVAAATLLLGAYAAAGARYYQPVYIYSYGGVPRGAYGTLGSARNSADSLQYIGCQVSAWTSSGTSMLCWARDAAGATAICSSSDARLVQVALGANGDSLVHFEWDASGTCTYLNVRAVSYYEPKS